MVSYGMDNDCVCVIMIGNKIYCLFSNDMVGK